MDPKFAQSVWLKNTAIAEKTTSRDASLPSSATSGTRMRAGGDNLHRNVIYRDRKDKADRVLPFTTFQSENPEDLWKWMAEWEKTTADRCWRSRTTAICPTAACFALTTFAGEPMSKDWAAERQRWEPLFEAIQ